MKLNKKNKKALSEVVSYVLLIVVAVVLAGLVFTWLMVFVPEEKKECPDGIFLTIKDHNCPATALLEITFQNKGNFNIDGVYMKYSNDINIPAIELPTDENSNINEITRNERAKGFFYFGRSIPSALRPNKEYAQNFSYLGSITKVQVQPFINDEENIGNLIICEDKTIIMDITC